MRTPKTERAISLNCIEQDAIQMDMTSRRSMCDSYAKAIYDYFRLKVIQRITKAKHRTITLQKTLSDRKIVTKTVGIRKIDRRWKNPWYFLSFIESDQLVWSNAIM